MRCVCSALPQENAILKRYFSDTVFCTTGIGNYHTIFSLTQFLGANPQITDIVFVGICGWSGSTHPIVQVASVINTHTKKEIIIPIIKQIAPLVTMLSAETPIHDKDQMDGYQFVDMESYGVAFVADKFRLPCTILRIPYDEISTTSSCVTVDRVDAMRHMESMIKTGLTPLFEPSFGSVVQEHESA